MSYTLKIILLEKVKVSFFGQGCELTVCHQNVQCMSNKILLIDEVFNNDCYCDILFLTEHWQSPEKIKVLKLSNFTN